MTLRKCNRCEEEKDLSLFTIDKRRALGFATVCKQCSNLNWKPRRDRSIPALNQDMVKEMLDYDQETGVFTWKINHKCGVKVGDVAGGVGAYGYHYIAIKGQIRQSHRIAWLYVYGYMPNEIDHIDHVRTNNKTSNLRDVKHVENARNMSKSKLNKSGYTGVFFEKKRSRWIAHIGAGGNLGRKYFSLKEDAVAWRLAKEVELGYHKNHGIDQDKILQTN
jgi:hypothetical protein